MSLAWRLARPLLFHLSPEAAHRAAIAALKSGAMPAARPGPPGLRQHLLGLDFPNPIGMAAGFDKNAEVADRLFGLGFGFVEIGTVTPVPQAGNAGPRIFRLARDRALINRMGFPSEGHDAVHARLRRGRRRGIVGVNIGANRDSSDRAGDYAAGVARFVDVADYIAINVSSPNTAGLRDLQEKRALEKLLLRVVTVRDAAAGRRVPLLLKIAPDLDDAALAAIAETAVSVGIEGMIVTNTTVARDGLFDSRLAGEAGGLSGRPLYRRSTAMLARLRKLVGRRLVLIGVGGVESPETAIGKIRAGADLIQLYTGLIYEGPDLPARLNAALAEHLAQEGAATVADIVGRDADRWAAGGG